MVKPSCKTLWISTSKKEGKWSRKHLLQTLVMCVSAVSFRISAALPPAVVLDIRQRYVIIEVTVLGGQVRRQLAALLPLLRQSR